MNNVISSVNDNQEKRYTYQENMKRYKKAIKEEFYFEALLIVYAVLEDRLRSFLYYIGATKNPQSQKLNETCSQKALMNLYFNDEKHRTLNFTNISVKIKLILCTLDLLRQDRQYNDFEYLGKLVSIYKNKFETEHLENLLKDIQKWLPYRNEIIHGLLNKNVKNVDEILKMKVIEGMQLARELDKFKGILKRYKSRVKLGCDQEVISNVK